ncbi:hypothetical protein JD844_019039 [Phrynosoma platyrhinos]|uniref:LSM family member 14B n=1 Tax=Phrynosoma platyrhinos TaxID=52577 RepID=A0ABQ7SPL7_PHRPL|nr:hypothetical protein JD844_019039 [Phrynosoma platyrhinos]
MLFFKYSKVRSFGTEDRPTDRPAPPREEVYEYIIFRGSDIKDITVCEPPKAQHNLPQDPAIVQSSLSSASASSFQSHVPYSPFRGMPPYSQLAASSLIGQQYAASLGLEKLVSPPTSAAASSPSTSSSPQPVSEPDLSSEPHLLSSKGRFDLPYAAAYFVSQLRNAFAIQLGVNMNYICGLLCQMLQFLIRTLVTSVYSYDFSLLARVRDGGYWCFIGFSSGAAFSSVHSVRKSPMVEQAVQTGPIDSNLNPKKIPQVKATPAIQRNTRQIQQSNKTSDTVEPTPVQTQGQVNDENRRPQRRRSDDKVETGEEKGEPTVTAENCDGTTDEDLLGPNCYYDKTKSFFDNISSELKSSTDLQHELEVKNLIVTGEKKNNLFFSSRRTTWAEERKLNTETFGVSGRFLRGRSFRGGFRGARGSGAVRRTQAPPRVGTGRV